MTRAAMRGDDPTNPNPHGIPNPFRRRKVRRRLLPIDAARSATTGVLMWAPVRGALPAIAPHGGASSDANAAGPASASPAVAAALPPTALTRMVAEWPGWTIKQWLKILLASPYLYRKPHFQERIADIKKRPKLILRNSSQVGGLKLACLVTGHIRFNRALLKLDLSSNALTSNAIAIVCRALEQHQTCRELNLSDNFVCADGAKAVSLVVAWLLSAVAPIPLVLLARTYASVYVIPSESMAPALAKNDVLLVDKVGLRRMALPERGDVVVFDQPPALRELVGGSVAPSAQFVKRVAGLPGDAADFAPRDARADAPTACREPPKAALADAVAANARRRDGPVAPGAVWVRGDCDSVSVDSRIWGDLDRRYLVGRPTFRLWPPARIGPL